MKWITVSDRTHVIRSFATVQAAEVYMFKRSALRPKLHLYRRWAIIFPNNPKKIVFRSKHVNIEEKEMILKGVTKDELPTDSLIVL